MQRRRFQISSAKEHFVQLYPIIADIVEELGLTGDGKFRFAVCVSEAFTNAFYHGNHADPDKTVSLLFSWDQESLTVEIDDEGKGKLADIDAEKDLKNISPEETSGRGLAIINKFADNFEVIEKDGGGLRVKMSWQRRIGPGAKATIH